MTIAAGERLIMTDARRPLSADRWASRRGRALAFLREHGIGGLVGSIRAAGAHGTAEFVVRHARYSVCIFLGKQWDRTHSVDTGGQIEIQSLDVVGPNADMGYPAVSTSPSTFAYFSQFFPQDRSQYSFVDLGCGKGRTLLLASKLGFRKVVGVEFAGSLCETARTNIARFPMRKEHRDSCVVVHADATQFDLPNGNLVLYFGNPFGLELWPAMLANIAESLRQNPRHIRLVLAGSLGDAISATGRLIAEHGLFNRIAQGAAPFYLDTYRPFHYEVFEASGVSNSQGEQA
jgi:SAM-dependent methyltransferase